jgi:hypothetical protein
MTSANTRHLSLSRDVVLLETASDVQEVVHLRLARGARRIARAGPRDGSRRPPFGHPPSAERRGSNPRPLRRYLARAVVRACTRASRLGHTFPTVSRCSLNWWPRCVRWVAARRKPRLSVVTKAFADPDSDDDDVRNRIAGAIQALRFQHVDGYVHPRNTRPLDRVRRARSSRGPLMGQRPRSAQTDSRDGGLSRWIPLGPSEGSALDSESGLASSRSLLLAW